jgi:hypothetical protein
MLGRKCNGVYAMMVGGVRVGELHNIGAAPTVDFLRYLRWVTVRYVSVSPVPPWGLFSTLRGGASGGSASNGVGVACCFVAGMDNREALSLSWQRCRQQENKMIQLRDLACIKRGQRRSKSRMLECGGNVVDSGSDSINIRWCGHMDVVWKPTEGVRFAFPSGLPRPCVATVMVEGRPNVPCVFTVWRPGAALLCFRMYKNACSWEANGGAVVIVHAAYLIPHTRKVWD